MKRLFVDMDGSLANIHERNWQEECSKPGFFLDLRPYTNMVEAVSRLTERDDVRVYILSAAEPRNTAPDEKEQWLGRQFLGHTPIGCFFTKHGESKANHIRDFFGVDRLQPDDFLLDDYSVHLLDWEAAGGTGIKVINQINGRGEKFAGTRVSVQESPEEIYGKLCGVMGIDEDITDLTLTVMVGLPGSGKSAIASELGEMNPNCAVISSDAIRRELFGDESDQKDPELVFKTANSRVHTALANGTSVVYDATNMYKKSRKKVLAAIPRGKDVTVRFWVVNTPLEECLRRNSEYDRVVPEDVIRKMAAKFIPPTANEWRYGTCIVTGM